MPRRGNVPKREVLPDPIYNSVLVTKLVNSIMLDGKKGVAQKIVYGAFEIIKEKTGKEPMEVFEQRYGEHHACPGGQGPPCRRRHLSGAHGGPSRAPPDPRSALAHQLLPRSQREEPWRERLAGEIMDAANSTGSAVKKREDTHKMAEANKAFAHYRW